MYIFAGNGLRNDHPEVFIFCDFKRNVFIIYKFLYEVAGYVEAGTCYIVVGTSLSGIDLKEFVTIVTNVVFDVKVRKSDITDGL